MTQQARELLQVDGQRGELLGRSTQRPATGVALDRARRQFGASNDQRDEARLRQSEHRGLHDEQGRVAG